ncbi:MAG: acetate--CoA ligase family protein [bacterium]|nr:acetate--CoA ligase family protein [bacterium]
MLSFLESKKLLDSYNIPLVNQRLAFYFDEAADFAVKNGFPVALKIVSKNLIHKTEEQAFLLNIKNEEELKKSWQILEAISGKKEIKSGFEGILVQKMAQGIELIIGAKKDEIFGPVIMFGIGGVFAEIYKDIVFRLAPINKIEAEKMIKEIKGYKILTGFRGKKAVDIGNLAEILVKISDIISQEKNIKEIDLNPVMVQGKEINIVDVKIIV